MASTGFVSEALRLFHKACREGRTADVVNHLRSAPPDLLETRSAATGRTVRTQVVRVVHTRTYQVQLSGDPYNLKVIHTNYGVVEEILT